MGDAPNTYYASSADVNLVRNVFVPSYTFDGSLGQFVVQLDTNLRGDVNVGDSSTNYSLKVNGNIVQTQLPTGTYYGDYIFWNGTDYQIGNSNVTIGSMAGEGSSPSTGQSNSVAIGVRAGYQTQQNNNIAIGTNTGYLLQGSNAIAIGTNAGVTNQIANSIILNATGLSLDASVNSGLYVAPIRNATTLSSLYYNPTTKEITYGVSPSGGGGTTLPPGINFGNYLYWDGSAYVVGDSNIRLGANAGILSQGSNAIAIGVYSGQGRQKDNAIAIGAAAGRYDQSDSAVAIGESAGSNNQQAKSIAIGYLAGYNTQGSNAIAIGSYAGANFQISNSIILNATGSLLQAQTLSGFYVAPVRSNIGAQSIYYDPTTKELTYGAIPSTGSVPSGTNYGDYLIWNPGTTTYIVGSQNIALGGNAGCNAQGGSAVAIGANAGRSSQGAYSIAIGASAGTVSQPSRSIILNASGSAVNASSAGFYVAPVRNAQGPNSIYFDPATSELTYGVTPSGGSGTTLPPGTYTGDYLYWSNGAYQSGSSNITIGASAGVTNQGANSVAIGVYSGGINQSGDAVSIGHHTDATYVGQQGQGYSSVAIGRVSGQANQGQFGVAIGDGAGYVNQSEYAVAVGFHAGLSGQGANSVAIGRNAGVTNQAQDSIAIGTNAGNVSQGGVATAIGYAAGQTNQGTAAVAIGYLAATTNQHNFSIAINAEGGGLQTQRANACYIAPIRSDTTTSGLYNVTYNTTTREVTTTNYAGPTSVFLTVSGNVTLGNAAAGQFSQPTFTIPTSSANPYVYLNAQNQAVFGVVGIYEITIWMTNSPVFAGATPPGSGSVNMWFAYFLQSVYQKTGPLALLGVQNSVAIGTPQPTVPTALNVGTAGSVFQLSSSTPSGGSDGGYNFVMPSGTVITIKYLGT